MLFKRGFLFESVPLCYCFGFDESHIQDLSRTGTSTISSRKFISLGAAQLLENPAADNRTTLVCDAF
jgi:hypothetical protein